MAGLEQAAHRNWCGLCVCTCVNMCVVCMCMHTRVCVCSMPVCACVPVGRGTPPVLSKTSAAKPLQKSSRQPPYSLFRHPNGKEGFATSASGGWTISKVDFLIFKAQKGGQRREEEGARPISQTDPKRLMIMSQELATGA